MVMFDSLNRHLLPPYGADWTHAPNFRRLAERTVTYDTCYAGSMPCMPARRERHTGRHNFLHRGWGPLEPFDDSMPEILKRLGVYTHLVSDHQHYWEDGGATYHGRYNSWEFFRGQEGDAWRGQVADPDIPDSPRATRGDLWRQDWVNRQYLDTEAEQLQTLTFDAGLDFGTLLFDLAADPHQEKPVSDTGVELRMARLLAERLRADDAPADQYARLGLPYTPEEVTEDHLLVEVQRERAETGRQPAARSDEFTEGVLNLRTPLADLLAEPAAADAIRRAVPGLLDTELLTVRGDSTLLQIAAFTGHPARPQLAALADELARLFPASDHHPSHDGEPSR
ncbi:sulfatase-like hydrolase/transferase [Streptomyces sp. NPDC088706]